MSLTIYPSDEHRAQHCMEMRKQGHTAVVTTGRNSIRDISCTTQDFLHACGVIGSDYNE